MGEIKTFEQRKKELIEKGKKTGILTYEELAESLKGLELDSDSLDDLYNFLVDNNIEITSDDAEPTGDDEDDGGLVDLEDLALSKDIKINNLKLDLIYTYKNTENVYYKVVPFSKMKDKKYLKNYDLVYEEFSDVLKSLDKNIEVLPLGSR